MLQNFYDNSSQHHQPLVPSQRQQIPNNSNTNATTNNNLMPSPTFRSNLPPSPCPTLILSSSEDDNNSFYNNPQALHQVHPPSNTNSRLQSNTFSFINNTPSMNG